jgi:4-hydroxymandelate oxidase
MTPQTQLTAQLAQMQKAAREAMSPEAWEYLQGTAGSPDLDVLTWQSIPVVPRVLQGMTGVDTSVVLGGAELATPVVVSATAAHRLAHPDAEMATAAGAAAQGALMVYSNSAAV